MSKYPHTIAIAHISDLHFGDVLANNVFSFASHRVGYAAHDFMLCLDFPNALEFIRAELLDISDDEVINTVVSGDLSATGIERDFIVAHTILRSRVRIKRDGLGRDAGFSLADDRIGAVPGNHDHWNGLHLSRPRAYTPSIFPTHFRQTPWVKRWSDAASKIELEIYGIDSNSGLASMRTNLRARGSFSKAELDGLRIELEKSKKRAVEEGTSRVRALVTHHSLSYAGGPFGAMTLDYTSRDELLKIAAEYKIAVIMTGHTHDLDAHPHPVHDPNGIINEVWELRSATTFQGPAWPKHQGFWCHTIWLSANGPRWYGWRFQWAGTRFEIKAPHSATGYTPDVDISLPTV